MKPILKMWVLILCLPVACQHSSSVKQDTETGGTETETETAIVDSATATNTDSETRDTESDTGTISLDSATAASTDSETRDTESDTGTISLDSATAVSTDSETNDTGIDTAIADSDTASETETATVGIDTLSDDTDESDSDTGTGEEFVPDCDIGNFGYTIAFDGYEYKHFFYGYFVGNCVSSTEDCSGIIGKGEIYSELSTPSTSSCASGQDCCLRSCNIENAPTEDANKGWCQRPDQYCHGGTAEPSVVCGDELVCCPLSREMITLPPCKFSNPPSGFREGGMCILPEQTCAYGISDQQSTCDDGLVCCPKIDG